MQSGKTITLAQLKDLASKVGSATQNGSDAAKAVAAETSARETAISTETAAREQGDRDSLKAVSDEAALRETADVNLQKQIDAVVAASDVKDVVGTKAELDAYDTATLGKNDIIKVLKDESAQNATTYYRWNLKSFSPIGSEGPYYTRSEVDSLLNGKATTTSVTEAKDAASAAQQTANAAQQTANTAQQTANTANGACSALDTRVSSVESQLVGLESALHTINVG